LLKRRALEVQLHEASTIVITANGIPLEKVDLFRYLGRPLSCNNNNWPAVFHNLMKAQTRWGRLSKPLIKTGVDPRIVGLFYKTIVQAVLLYACETWVITQGMIKMLRYFHHRVAMQIADH
jgi:hypothetical protein